MKKTLGVDEVIGTNENTSVNEVHLSVSADEDMIDEIASVNDSIVTGDDSVTNLARKISSSDAYSGEKIATLPSLSSSESEIETVNKPTTISVETADVSIPIENVPTLYDMGNKTSLTEINVSEGLSGKEIGADEPSTRIVIDIIDATSQKDISKFDPVNEREIIGAVKYDETSFSRLEDLSESAAQPKVQELKKHSTSEENVDEFVPDKDVQLETINADSPLLAAVQRYL